MYILIYLSFILFPAFNPGFLWISRYGVPLGFLLCKVMAAQTDTKDRAKPLLG